MVFSLPLFIFYYDEAFMCSAQQEQQYSYWKLEMYCRLLVVDIVYRIVL